MTHASVRTRHPRRRQTTAPVSGGAGGHLRRLLARLALCVALGAAAPDDRTHGGGGGLLAADSGPGNRVPNASSSGTSQAPDPGASEQVRDLYNLRCAGCHGKDGKAKTPMARKLRVKDLTLSKTTNAEIEKQIKEGKQDPKGNTLMPAFKSVLTPEEIESLIAFVKAFRKEPAPASASADDGGKAR